MISKPCEQKVNENCRWNETTSGFSRPYMQTVMLKARKKIFLVRFDRTEPNLLQKKRKIFKKFDIVRVQFAMMNSHLIRFDSVWQTL